MLQHQGIRNPHQKDAERAQIILFHGVSAHRIDLRVNAAIELKGEPMFEAVKIEDAVFNTELMAKLRAQPTVTQQLPRVLFRLLGLARNSRIRAVGTRVG